MQKLSASKWPLGQASENTAVHLLNKHLITVVVLELLPAIRKTYMNRKQTAVHVYTLP